VMCILKADPSMGPNPVTGKEIVFGRRLVLSYLILLSFNGRIINMTLIEVKFQID